MTVLESPTALEALDTLNTTPPKDVVLSFTEQGGLMTARWAVNRFGSQLLIDKAMDEFSQNSWPVDENGKKVDVDYLSDHERTAIMSVQEIAEETGQDIKKDLDSAIKRVGRGYRLGDVAFRGAYDATAIIGSLAKAVEVNPENLNSNEVHHQEAARFMLDHLQVRSDDENSQSYLI